VPPGDGFVGARALAWVWLIRRSCPPGHSLTTTFAAFSGPLFITVSTVRQICTARAHSSVRCRHEHIGAERRQRKVLRRRDAG